MTINWTTSERLRGAQVDKKISWSEHVVNATKSFASKPSLLLRMRFLPRKQLVDFYTKVLLPSVTYGFVVLGSCNKTHFSNLEKLHARAGRIVNGLPWDTSAVLTLTQWNSLEAIYKVRLMEFVFKCNKGFNFSEFKDIFVQRNSSRESRRNGNIILPRLETNFTRNSIQYRGAIAKNSLSSKESAAKNLNEFKRFLTKLDISEINSDSIVAVIKHKENRYEYY